MASSSWTELYYPSAQAMSSEATELVEGSTDDGCCGRFCCLLVVYSHVLLYIVKWNLKQSNRLQYFFFLVFDLQLPHLGKGGGVDICKWASRPGSHCRDWCLAGELISSSFPARKADGLRPTVGAATGWWPDVIVRNLDSFAIQARLSHCSWRAVWT